VTVVIHRIVVGERRIVDFRLSHRR
jgi:hypothetical protein